MRFEVGQKVMYSRGSLGRRYTASTVAKITPRKITLADGSEWTAAGRRWGSGNDPWSTGHLYEYREADVLQSAALDIADRLNAYKWRDLSLEELRAVAAIAFKAKEQA